MAINPLRMVVFAVPTDANAFTGRLIVLMITETKTTLIGPILCNQSLAETAIGAQIMGAELKIIV